MIIDGSQGGMILVSGNGGDRTFILEGQGPKGDKGDQGEPGSAVLNGLDAYTIATLSGAQTLTNKTIDGASNTITNLPASATPDAARRVAYINSTSANQWTKLLTFEAPSSYTRCNLLLGFSSWGGSGGSGTIVAVDMGTVGDGQSPTAFLEIVAKGAGTTLGDDSFKVIAGAFGTPIELWIKTANSGSSIAVYELSRNQNTGTLTYATSFAWQSEPVGAAVNVASDGVSASGVPVVTTTGTQTLSYKTLQSPTIDAIKENNGKYSLAFYANPGATSYFQLTNGTTAVNFTALGSESNIAAQLVSKGTGTVNLSSSTNAGWVVWPQGTEYLGTYSAAAGTDPKITAQGTGANVGINLVPKGSATVQANGVPIVTTTGTQAITNKTISGASNTLSNIPQSAVTNLDYDYSHRVMVTASGGTTTENGANTWAKLATITIAGSRDVNLVFGCVGSYMAQDGATVGVTIRAGGAGSVPTLLNCEMLSKHGQAARLANDSFKLVSTIAETDVDAQGITTIELWVKKISTYGQFSLYELQRYAYSPTNVTVLYNNLAAWQSAEPTGAMTASTNGVAAGGVPVVTTTGTQALANKTLSSPTLNSPKIDAIKDTNSNYSFVINPVSNGVNYQTVQAGPAGVGVSLLAAGTDANISQNIWSKGSGAINIRSTTNGVVLAADPVASGVNYLKVANSATNLAPSISAAGADGSINLDLVPKGAGQVQANGVPVVTTSGTAALTNKTLTAPTITNPRIDNIYDTSTGARSVKFLSASASAVNPLIFTSSNTGNDPTVGLLDPAFGGDTNCGINFLTNGSGTVKANGSPVGVKVAVPATATSAGVPGQWAADASYHYVCTATNTWRRAALSTW